jgi:D-sedoheptulose 7-phosphate isomerase
MQNTESFAFFYIRESAEILQRLEPHSIEAGARLLAGIRRRKGRLFILGSGGGAGHASHAVNDFRKIAGIESYCPSDNVSELTARINDEGWENSYADWLQASRIGRKDGLLVFSVGGGCRKRKISLNLVRAMELARKKRAKIAAVTGRDGGEARKLANVLVLVPVVHPDRVTPHTESFQALLWHLWVSHPMLAKNKTKW